MKKYGNMAYQLLGRLVMDCDYYLGYGSRCEKHLWAGNVKDHLKYMSWLQESIHPTWLSKEQLNWYKKQMNH